MTLMPMDGLLATVANLEEVDPAGAAMLVQLGLYETLVDEVAKVYVDFQVDGLRVAANRTQAAREALLRTGVAKAIDGGDPYDPDLEEYAYYLDGLSTWVEKGLLSSAARAVFDQVHPRNDQGRFTRHNVSSEGTGGNQDVSSRQKSRNQDGAQQVAAWNENGLVANDGKVRAHYGRVVNGQIQSSEVSATHPVKDVDAALAEHSAANPDLLLLGVSMDRNKIPNKDPRQRAALDAMATFVGPNGAAAMAPTIRGLPAGRPNANETAANWNRPTDDNRSTGDRQTYRRASIVGDALTAMPEGSNANLVGHLARAIGDLGPEAEKVLAPGIRRTAYRYRGTEKRPEPGIIRAVDESRVLATALASDDGDERDNFITGLADAAAKDPRGSNPVQSIAGKYYAPRSHDMSLDQLELGLQGDAAVVALSGQVVNEKTAEISMEAGELPPSQGVLINANGEVVAQAQGYNGDHYLPFNLRNLGDLKGGQYVRTRAAGGLTTEDVYTGLLAGARQVQVVSNSGVFTMEFDPDLRGGRRYSDKAQRMIQRYGRLLGAIEGGNLYDQDVDDPKQAELRRQAYDDVGWDKEAGDDRFRVLRDRARLEGGLNQDSDDELMTAAEKAVDEEYANRSRSAEAPSHQQRARRIEETFHEMRNGQASTQVRRKVLDGQGYSDALNALKQEFPFFIRSVSYQPVPKFFEQRGVMPPRAFSAGGTRRDKGFVERGQTNPKSFAANHGRMIPTSYTPPKKEGDEEGKETTASTTTGGGKLVPTQSGETTSPASRLLKTPMVTMSLAEKTKPLSDISPSDPALRNKLTVIASQTAPLLKEANVLTPNGAALYATGADPDDALSSNPLAYAHGVWHHKVKEDSGDLLDWLSNASSRERTKFFEGLREANESLSAEATGPVANDAAIAQRALKGIVGDTVFEDNVERLEAMTSTKHLFVQAPQDWKTAGPAKDGTPYAINEIVRLGSQPANYEAFPDAVRREAPQSKIPDAIAHFEGKSRKDQLRLVTNAYGAYAQSVADNKPDDARKLAGLLEGAHVAYAFHVGRAIAEQVNPDPKVGKAAPYSRAAVQPQSVRKASVHPTIAAFLAL